MLHSSLDMAFRNGKVKVKGQTFVIAPLSRQSHHRGAQVHGAHQAASHIPALNLPSHIAGTHLPTQRGGGFSKPRPRVQRETGP